jgi:hypothetical protein
MLESLLHFRLWAFTQFPQGVDSKQDYSMAHSLRSEAASSGVGAENRSKSDEMSRGAKKHRSSGAKEQRSTGTGSTRAGERRSRGAAEQSSTSPEHHISRAAEQHSSTAAQPHEPGKRSIAAEEHTSR